MNKKLLILINSIYFERRVFIEIIPLLVIAKLLLIDRIMIFNDLCPSYS